MTLLKLFFEQLFHGELPALAILAVAVTVVLLVIWGRSMAHGLSHEDREANRRIGYKHKLRDSRPVVVYVGTVPAQPPPKPKQTAAQRRVTKAEDPWAASPHERTGPVK